jgi:hypothetical protein
MSMLDVIIWNLPSCPVTIDHRTKLTVGGRDFGDANTILAQLH